MNAAPPAPPAPQPPASPDARPGASGSDAWTVVIGPPKGAFDWRLGELWASRDLIALFVWRDFVAFHKQTVLGPAWHLLQPLLTTLTFTVVFGKMTRIPTDGHPAFLFYLASIVPWTYFSGCLTKTAATFAGNAALFGKVYFHRLTIPISIVLSGLIGFGIQLTLFLAVWAFYLLQGANVGPTAWLLAVPVVVLMLGGYSLGAGIIVSALTTRYRDLAMLVAFGVQLLMFATPVIYPISAVPVRYRSLLSLNPLSPLWEAFRAGFLGGGSVSAAAVGYSFAVMLGLLLIGLMLFTRVERTFMDTV